MHIEHIELRKNLRISINMDISYSSPNPGDAGKPATLLDVSENGAGLVLDEPLNLNQTLRLEGYGEWEEPRDAKVRWVRKANEHYRVGVEFIDKP